jgi:hypothetical protein
MRLAEFLSLTRLACLVFRPARFFRPALGLFPRPALGVGRWPTFALAPWVPLGLALGLLAGCGDLPQPFLGNPGATGRILAQPPTPRLAVPIPPQALLSDQGAEAFAKALAEALRNQEVPAVAGPARPGDWRLEVTVGLQGATVVPVYAVHDPEGHDRGKSEGKPLASADWNTATPATLSRAATQAAPGVADLLTSIQAAMQRADPKSLYNRPARVQVVEVTGAPGDGNLALTRQMRSQLSQFGPVVQDTATGADFIVRCTVKLVPIPGDQQRVEIQWSVATPSGDERGRVVQLNNVPAGSLDGYWGDVATVVAQEAAGGVRDVILRQSGRTPGESKAEPGIAPGAGQKAGQALDQGVGPSAGSAVTPAAGTATTPAAASSAGPSAGPATTPAATPATTRGSSPQAVPPSH